MALLLTLALVLAACGGRDEDLGRAQGREASPVPAAGDTWSGLAAPDQSEPARAASSPAQGPAAGPAVTRSATAGVVTAYRFYNLQTGAHFYTVSETERDSIRSNLAHFQYEGPAFLVSGTAAQGLHPVHRFFNRQTGVHFYTISESERANVVANLPQFNYEGIAYFASQVPGPGLLPFYRFYVPGKGFHFYTASEAEKASIVARLGAVYRYEGVGYYVLDETWGQTATAKLPHSGMTDQQCYQGDSGTLVACSSAGATAFNSEQDGHRTDVNPMSFSEVSNPAGGQFARTECVKDNVTGLMWEGKTASGERAGSLTYTNFDNPDKLQRWDWDSSRWVSPTQGEIEAGTNSVGYMNYVNSMALCGYTDWRLPAVDELQGIVDYSIAHPGPAIQTAWFPNTHGTGHWTSDVHDLYAEFGWVVEFYNGGMNSSNRDGALALRLVRGGLR